MNIKRRFSICIVMAMFGVFSCAPVENAATPVITLSPSSTPEIHQQLPTRTPTYTRYPTPVPISPEQILQAYFHLVEGNTCELPCLLGIVPGQTMWEDAKSLLAPYTSSTRLGLEGKYGQFAAIVLDEQRNNLELRFTIGLEYQTIYLIEMSNQTPLSEFLVTAGPPNQVLLWSAGLDGMDMGASFGMVLEYYRRGILAFIDGDFQIVDGKAQICPDQLKEIQLVILWSPEDIRFIGDLVRLDSFKGIENVSDTTVGEFYDNYSNENTDYCIKLNY
jgi:hypothetical protein